MSSEIERLFEMDDWKVIEKRFRPETNENAESIFSLANEVAGIRGNLEEGCSLPSLKGSYFNGIYERRPLEYLCPRKGWTENICFIVNNINWIGLAPVVDGERLDLADSNFSDYQRTLDMREGILLRSFTWHTKSGKRLKINYERFLSMVDRNQAAISMTIEAIDSDCEIQIESSIDAKVPHQQWGNQIRVFEDARKSMPNKGLTALKVKTEGTGFHVAVASLTEFDERKTNWTLVNDKVGQIGMKFVFKLSKGQTTRVVKHLAFATSLESYPDECIDKSVERVIAFAEKGYDYALKSQKNYWYGFWQNNDIELDGDIAVQQGIRFNLFQLHMAYSGYDSKFNIGPKGMTGENYLGATFWDTEAYCLPSYLFTQPQAAKKLLEYRYDQLGAYRSRAEELGYKGMKVPMITLDGSECCPGGDMSLHQLHVNTVIPYAVWLVSKMLVCDDFLFEKGFDFLVENARFWLSRSSFNWRCNKYVINTIVGPDEYRPYSDNNAYTNAMVKHTIDFAIKTYGKISKKSPEKQSEIAQRLNLQKSEVERWQLFVDNLYLQSVDDQLGVIPQDDTFLDASFSQSHRIDPKDIPLYAHWPYERLLRMDVIKQPDVLLAYLLLGDSFCDKETLARCYRYYEPRTTHDSSLSACVHGVLAAELGLLSKAYEFMSNSVRLDLDNRNKNVHQGLHLTAMGGAWMSIVMGFGGLRWNEGAVSFWPIIPNKLKSISFKIVINGSIIRVNIDQTKVLFENIKGDAVEFLLYGELLKIESGQSVSKKIKLAKSIQKTRAVLFDLDGVLTNSDKYHYQAWKTITDKEGIYFDESINNRLRGVCRMQSLEIILEKSQRTYLPEQKKEFAEMKNSIFKKYITNITPKDIAPGAKEFLEELKHVGWKIALCSSSKNAKAICDNLGITDYFDAFVDGNQIEHTKPHPEIFLRAAKMLNMYPGDCIVFEDAQAGIDAAKMIGAVAVGVCPENEQLLGSDLNIKIFEKQLIGRIQSI